MQRAPSASQPDAASTLQAPPCGRVDNATRDRVSGWAQDSDAPGKRVSLLITLDGALSSRVLADRARSDLRQAGIGDGRHSFDVALRGVSPLHRHVLAVVRESDGVHLEGSPVVLEPATRFDAAFQAFCASLLADTTEDAESTERLAFLALQVELLLQRRSERRSRRAERAALRQIKWRWRDTEVPAATARRPEPLPPRALFIDEEIPVVSRDAGSNAVLSHMRSLRRLGFEVTFVAADMAADANGTLEASGIACCHAPWHGSVEEVLRREADSFDLVYLHRGTIAFRYLAFVRFHQPKARIIYSVADLHHLRLSRQAQAEDRPELLVLARQSHVNELRAAAAAHAVITHSSYEAAILREQLPRARVHVIPWSVPVRETTVPFSDRHGLAFIGHYGHSPNVDAAQWLTTEIMPHLRKTCPGMTCLLAGSDMPDRLRRKADGIEAVGQVGSLMDIFDRVRLTIAPMAFGAGIKGKVLESLAAGIPCVCTPIAAEGLDLPTPLLSLVAADAAGLAANAARLHEDEGLNRACREAGLAYVTAAFSEARIDTLMGDVAALPAAAVAMTGAETPSASGSRTTAT